MKKEKIFLSLLLALVVFFGVACATVFVGKRKDNQNMGVNSNSTGPISSADISDLSQYTNNKYGFSFRYPNDWTLTEQKNVIDVWDPQVITITYKDSFRLIITNDSFEQYKNKIEQSDVLEDGTSLALFNNDQIEKEIDGHKTIIGTHITAIGINQQYYYIFLDKYTALYFEFNEPDALINANVANIIESLNFWSADSKVYENEQYNVQFRYPSDFILKDYSGTLFSPNFFNQQLRIQLSDPNAANASEYTFLFFSGDINTVLTMIKNIDPIASEVKEESDIVINNQQYHFISMNTSLGNTANYYIRTINSNVIVWKIDASASKEIIDNLLNSTIFYEIGTQRYSQWTTYQDETTGFKIQYPPTWTRGESDQEYGKFIQITPNEGVELNPFSSRCCCLG